MANLTRSSKVVTFTLEEILDTDIPTLIHRAFDTAGETIESVFDVHARFFVSTSEFIVTMYTD